jgi:hypothetical protein
MQQTAVWFKDAFHHGEFQTDWGYLRRPLWAAAGATLVFYPHGSLAVARDYIGDETKIALASGPTVTCSTRSPERWSSGRYVPVFVSEGTSKEKVAAIRRSHYLTNVYEEVLPAIGESLVVYGWSFDERDQHVLDAISAIRRSEWRSPCSLVNQTGSAGVLPPGAQGRWPVLARHHRDVF